MDCINLPDANGTALHYAVRASSLACVRLFLRNPQTDVNAADQGGNTPLHIAFERGLTEISRALLRDTRVNVNAINTMGETVLHCVARANPTRNAPSSPYYRWTPPYTCHNIPTLAAELRQLILSDVRFTAAHALNFRSQSATMVAD